MLEKRALIKISVYAAHVARNIHGCLLRPCMRMYVVRSP